MSTTQNASPAGITVRPLAMGEATRTPDGGIILADPGDTLLHVALAGGCLHLIMTPEEVTALGRDLVRNGAAARRRRRRGE